VIPAVNSRGGTSPRFLISPVGKINKYYSINMASVSQEMRLQGSRLTVLAAWRSAIQARGEDSRRTTAGVAEDRRLQISRTRGLGKGG